MPHCIGIALISMFLWVFMGVVLSLAHGGDPIGFLVRGGWKVTARDTVVCGVIGGVVGCFF